MFSFSCLQTLSTSWCRCFRARPFWYLSLYYLSLPNTGSSPSEAGTRCRYFDIDGGKKLLAYSSTPFISYAVGFMEVVEKRAGCEFLLRIALWTCECVAYWNWNVNCAVKGHTSTTEMWEPLAADWCHISNGTPLRAELHLLSSYQLWFQMKVTWGFWQRCILTRLVWKRTSLIVLDVWCVSHHMIHSAIF